MVRRIMVWVLVLAAFPLAFSAAIPATASAQEATTTSSSDLRLALQGRLDAINVILVDNRAAVVPYITPGVRLIDEKLFVGLGFGFFNVESGNGGFSFSPMVSFDILRETAAALNLGAWLNLANFGAPDAFVWGINAVAGVRALLSSAFAVGAELGWGMLSVDGPGDDDVTVSHGVIGNITVEASIGL